MLHKSVEPLYRPPESLTGGFFYGHLCNIFFPGIWVLRWYKPLIRYYVFVVYHCNIYYCTVFIVYLWLSAFGCVMTLVYGCYILCTVYFLSCQCAK